jgi:diguanylate cyclase (GGDEF)-like protein
MKNTIQGLLDKVELGLILIDEEYNIVLWNEWLEKFTGIPKATACGKRLAKIAPRFAQCKYGRIFSNIFSNGQSYFFSAGIHKYFVLPEGENEESEIRQNMKAERITSAGKNYIFLQIHNVTNLHFRLNKLNEFLLEKKKKELVYKKSLNIDPLTGINNRKYFYEMLDKKVLKKTEKFAVAFIDLDYFKTVNDIYGHDIGDQLLTEIARLLSAVFGEKNTVVRYGGDEFAALLEIKNKEQFLSFFAQLCQRTEKPFLIEGTEHQLSASVGLAFFPEDGESSRELLKNADAAMYNIKGKKKERIEYALYRDLD